MRYSGLVAAASVLLMAPGIVQGEEPPADALQAKSAREIIEEEFERACEESRQANLAKFIQAKTSEEAGLVCRELFSSRHLLGLHDLLTHENANVAIQAAWCLNSRELPRRHAYFGGGDFRLRYHPDIQRFLGVLEGRLRVSVPEWWERAIEDVHFQLPNERELSNRGWSRISRGLLEEPHPTVTLSFQNGSTRESIEARIPVDSLRSVVGADDGFAVGGNSQRIVLFKGTHCGFASRLLCLDRTTLDECWRAETWGLTEVHPIAGQTFKDYVSIVVTSDRVFVFDASIGGAYFEAFDLKDGTNVARFATTNWGVRIEEPEADE